MIFEFEFIRIKHICQFTNDLLSFDIEEGKRDYRLNEKVIEMIKDAIQLFEFNRFDSRNDDSSYGEFNDKIDECISALENKIELTRCRRNSNVRIEFDESRYIDKINRGYETV